MKHYCLYDSLIESDKTTPFVVATRTLFSFLNLDVPSLKGAKNDLGSEILALKKEPFLERNAHTLSLAAAQNQSIVCPEYSTLTSLEMSKELLANDPILREHIAQKLSKKGIVLNTDVELLSLEAMLLESVGKERLQSLVKHPFNDFRMAYFLSTSACQTRKHTSIKTIETLFECVGVKSITFSKALESNGYEVLKASEDLAKKLCANALLDMFDNAADFVLVQDARSFVMCDYYQKACEKVCGRDIGLGILTLAQLLLLAFGVHDKAKLGFDKHKVPVTLL